MIEMENGIALSKLFFFRWQTVIADPRSAWHDTEDRHVCENGVLPLCHLRGVRTCPRNRNNIMIVYQNAVTRD